MVRPEILEYLTRKQSLGAPGALAGFSAPPPAPAAPPTMEPPVEPPSQNDALIAYMQENMEKSNQQYDTDANQAGMLRGFQKINQGLSGVAPDDVSFSARIKDAGAKRDNSQQMIRDYLSSKLADQRRRDDQNFQAGQNQLERDAITQRHEQDLGLKRDKESKEAKAAADLLKNKQNSEVASSKNVLGKIKEAISILDSSDLATGWAGRLTKDIIPGSPGNRLQAHLATVKANLGFDKLAEMREASKSGGALGAVSDRENDMLQAAVENLDQFQSEDDLRKNLAELQTRYESVISLVQKVQGGGSTPSEEAPSSTGGIKPGHVEEGYRFKGGDPSKPESWEKI